MKHCVSATLIGLFLAGCSGSVTAHRPDESALSTSMIGFRTASHYDAGKRHLNAGNHGLAIAEFRNALAREPASVPALDGLAIAYSRIGRNDIAADYWARALALDPNSIVTLNNLLFASMENGDQANATAYAARIAAVTEETVLHVDVPDVVASNVAIALGRPLASSDAPLPLEERLQAGGTLEQTGTREWRLETVAGGGMPTTSAQIAASSAIENFPTGIRLRISNGVGRSQMARRFADYFSGHGLKAGQIANAPNFDYASSYIFYNPGLEDAARQLASLMPVPVGIVEASSGQGSIEIVLGADLVTFDERLVDA